MSSVYVTNVGIFLTRRHYPTQKDKMESTVIIASHQIAENDINVS